MSFVKVTSGFLTIKPRVSEDGPLLVTKSSLILGVLTLFLWSRKVVVDKAKKRVTLQKRLFWFFTQKVWYPFERIESIGYGHSSFGTSWSLFHGRTDEMETFTVWLNLKNPKDKVHVWRFFGEGAVSTGMSGVMFGRDSMIDYAGDQEGASKAFVDLLESYTGKPLG